MADNVYNMSDGFLLKNGLISLKNTWNYISYVISLYNLLLCTTVIVHNCGKTWYFELSFIKYDISHQNLNGGQTNSFTHSSPSGQSPFVSSYFVQYTSGL